MLISLKKSNANQQYLTHKNHKYAKLEGESCQAAIQKLKKEKLSQQVAFSTFVKKNVTAVNVRYKIAHILGKKGKLFSNVGIKK